MTLASFDWLYAWYPLYFFSPCRSSKLISVPRCADDVMLMIREGALAFNTSKRRFVSRKCPRWFVANVASSPSAVATLLGRNVPALLMRTCSFLYRALKSCASSRTESCDERSATIESTFLFPLRVRISRSAASPLSLSRETITTVASSLARPSAVAFPIPEFAPVIRQTLPVMSTLFCNNLSLSDNWDSKSLSENNLWFSKERGLVFGCFAPGADCFHQSPDD